MLSESTQSPEVTHIWLWLQLWVFQYEGATLCPDQSSAYYNILRLIALYTNLTHENQFYYVQSKNYGSLAVWTPRHPTLDNKADTRVVSHRGQSLFSHCRQYWCTTSWTPLVPWVSKQAVGTGQLQVSRPHAGSSKDRNLILRGVNAVRFWRLPKHRRQLLSCRHGRPGRAIHFTDEKSRVQGAQLMCWPRN